MPKGHGGRSRQFGKACDNPGRSDKRLSACLPVTPDLQKSCAIPIVMPPSQQEQIRNLTERKYELQQEEEKSRLSPEEQKDAIMGKIKRDNQEVEALSIQVGVWVWGQGLTLRICMLKYQGPVMGT